MIKPRKPIKREEDPKGLFPRRLERLGDRLQKGVIEKIDVHAAASKQQLPRWEVKHQCPSG
jgi:hypothetical protein